MEPLSEVDVHLDRVRSTAQALSTVIDLVSKASCVLNWKRATSRRLFREYDWAWESFVAADTGLRGRLNAVEASMAAESFHRKTRTCASSVGSFSDSRQCQEFTFAQWVEGLTRITTLPEHTSAVLEAAQSGLRCICGAWMERRYCGDCYDNGAVRCDYSGKSVLSPEVWHCPRGKLPIHPFGQDIGVESTEAARHTQEGMALEARLAAKLCTPIEDSWERESLQARHAALGRTLLPAAVAAFSSISDDMSRVEAESAEPEASLEQLDGRLTHVKRVLAIEDWVQRYEEAAEAAEGVIEGMAASLDSLHHEQLLFRDAEDKRRQILALEHRS